MEVTLEELSPVHPTSPKYIPIESIIELRKKSLSTRQIAKILGCDHSNIVRRLNAYKAELQGIEPFKRNRADIFALVQAKIINNITDNDIAKASLLQKATSVAVLYDKERLERGQSTENIAYSSTITRIDDRSSEITKLKQLLGITEVEGSYQITGDNTPDNDDVLPPIT